MATDIWHSKSFNSSDAHLQASAHLCTKMSVQKQRGEIIKRVCKMSAAVRGCRDQDKSEEQEWPAVCVYVRPGGHEPLPATAL